MQRVTIDPITRLEGHGKIEIFLNERGEVENAYFQIPELRGFEKFVEGRAAEEVSRIVSRICGVCSGTHHVCAGKAIDKVFGVKPTSTALKLRRLFYSAHFIHSHLAHFYVLAAPDFVVGPEADPPVRNIVGLINKVGLETGGQVIKARRLVQEIQTMLGGRPVHPAFMLPGGVSKGLTEEERLQVEEWAEFEVEFARFSLKLFEDVVLKNKQYLELIQSDAYRLETNYMGIVDEKNRADFYDGEVRYVDTQGREIGRYKEEEYLEHVAEHVEPWSYLKFPFLKKVGWKGFVEGPGTSVYQAAPLGRINAADAMKTPLAEEERQKFFDFLGGRPVHNVLATHWARLIENLQAAEELRDLARDPEITSPDIRNIPEGVAGEGVGIIEAPRGTLTHHYQADEKGIIVKANLIVGTTNNNAPICMAVKKAAQHLIKPGVAVREGLLNMIEMAFRAFDPCFSCATHALMGELPLMVSIYNHNGELLEQFRRS
ncbi:Ni/Fe hydrogenase subunit alpha [Desulfothermobacter acidiphilus]|uniref:Ni/Fe hydrogenase subunit alpha n=1 Tax=Desulfothermobacter acidiphilus TaxID=1938353 RepID=UPI003F89B9B2